MNKNKIIIVAYYFPPFKAVGAIRVSKFVKYFHKHGWDVTVITVKEKYYGDQVDPATLKNIPSGVKVIRTPMIKKALGFKVPFVHWAINLFFCLYKLTKNNEFEYIYFTGNPFYQWIVAPIIKKIRNIPYILDFRDPWVLHPYAIRKKLSLPKFIEPYIVKNALYIINVTSEATDIFTNHYKKIQKDRFLTISNGYDPDDFTDIEKIDLNIMGLKIVYTGKFDTFRNPMPFLESLRDYNNNNKDKIYFIHVGKPESAIIDFLSENPGFAEYVIQTGYLTYKDALAYVEASDIGLIITGGHAYEPTTKIYEYIALDKYILSINDNKDGYLFNLLNKNKNGISVKNNKDLIYKALDSLADRACSPKIDKSSFIRENWFLKLEKKLLDKLY